MKTPSTYLKEWCSGRDFLLIVFTADDGHSDFGTLGLIKEISRNEIVLDLENAEEYRLRILENMTFIYSDTSDEQIKCSVLIKWPGFKFSLSLLRKQPVIKYLDSVED